MPESSIWLRDSVREILNAQASGFGSFSKFDIPCPRFLKSTRQLSGGLSTSAKTCAPSSGCEKESDVLWVHSIIRGTGCIPPQASLLKLASRTCRAAFKQIRYVKGSQQHFRRASGH